MDDGDNLLLEEASVYVGVGRQANWPIVGGGFKLWSDHVVAHPATWELLGPVKRKQTNREIPGKLRD